MMPWEARGKFVELLRADTIDPAAFETLRAEQIAKADAASKRVVQAMTEAASVLTVEQRRELTQRWEKQCRTTSRRRCCRTSEQNCRAWIAKPGYLARHHAQHPSDR